MRSVPNIVFASITALAGIAQAGPISYEFTTSWYEGELSGLVSNGYFSYDSSHSQPGETVETLDLFTDFEFSLRNFRYTEATVNSARASFYENGELRSIIFGTNCYLSPLQDGGKVGSCMTMSTRPDQFFIQYNADHPLYAASAGDDTYPDPGKYPWFSSGRTTIRLLENGEFPHQIPEPSAPLMIFSGLGLIAARRVRVKYSVAATATNLAMQWKLK